MDVTVHEAIPVTTPARTLIDLAAVSEADVVEEAIDDALRRGLVSIPRLRWRLSETTSQGRGGVPLLRALIEARSGGDAVPKSRFETRLLREIKRAGLPAPERQHPVRRDGAVVAVVDFAYRRERVAIEADSYRWHSGRLRFERDLTRRNALTALGWRVLHITWRELRDQPTRTTGAIREALSLSAR